MTKNVKTAQNILKDEIKGDMKSALSKMTKGYSMTWVYKSTKGVLFPRTKLDFSKLMKEVYVIKGRKYDIKNIAEGKNVVMVELVESYPDPETKKVYRTPLVLIMEFKDGKIKRGRHYCDPQISYLNLNKKQIDRIYK